MRYEGQIYRPPSEADAYIVQATVGCSWNHCTYCDMYRSKAFRVRNLRETLTDIEEAGRSFGRNVSKVFVADGDALVLDLDHWEAILAACRDAFPRLKRASAYATAMNVNAKRPEELRRLRELGLSLLYMGPETGDDPTFKRIAKGSNFEEHVEAARRAHEAGMKISAIFLLGAGGTERSKEHAAGSAKLITEMDPEFVSALTLTIIPGTPIDKMQAQGKFTLPSVTGLLEELRTIVAESSPANAVFRTNHASNYLPLAGRLPQDRERIVAVLDRALAGDITLRSESSRGL
ncbi:MAG: radical SAM protein [Polyangiales bacterium]